ncbi:hypothetical protein N7494_009452 [Penicillium frequentans]|uniref:Uncharacterized protein n=1 Tax=Penicillium frequentans TaxID=3151616 RepID=A0AAD6CQ18_9EURO|nr:hypothetical protein N7494_009452 [Penicillium glabrum]
MSEGVSSYGCKTEGNRLRGFRNALLRTALRDEHTALPGEAYVMASTKRVKYRNWAARASKCVGREQKVLMEVKVK